MSYSDILPDNIQAELIQLADDQTRIEFRVGDIVAQAVAWNAQNQKPTSLMEIYAAVGAFVGKSARTIRDYSAVSAFFPADIRDEYAVLKFDHFRQAMTLGPDWENALRWAVEQVDVLGRPASVDAMVAQFMPQEVNEPEYDDGAGEQSPIDTLRAAVTAIGRVLPEIDLAPPERGRAEMALATLREVAQVAV